MEETDGRADEMTIIAFREWPGRLKDVRAKGIVSAPPFLPTYYDHPYGILSEALL